MSWNNVIPSWCLVPCKKCERYHPDHIGCEENAENFRKSEVSGRNNEEKDDE